MIDLIKDGVEKLGIEYTEKQINTLLMYLGELSLWNKKLGLVNAEGRKLVINHIFDSLSGVNILKEIDFKTAADIGSGAGLPGIPLSIFFPDKSFTLVERSGNRCGFLRNCRELFRLDNVTVLESGLEKVSEQFDILTFRAFRDFNDFITPLLERLTDKGFLFAYKGKISEIEKELKASSLSEYRIEKVDVPFLDEERHIVIIPSQTDL